MTKTYRDDLLYAAYAVALGYELTLDHLRVNKALFSAGIPGDSLSFIKGDVYVWQTARGWRVTKLVDGMFPKAEADDFHSKLLDALEAGAKL